MPLLFSAGAACGLDSSSLGQVSAISAGSSVALKALLIFALKRIVQQVLSSLLFLMIFHDISNSCELLSSVKHQRSEVCTGHSLHAHSRFNKRT